MTGSRQRAAFFVGLFLGLLAVALQGVQCEELEAVPSEDLCRPYIEKALKDLGTGSLEQTSAEVEADGDGESHEEAAAPASEEAGDTEPGGEASEEEAGAAPEGDAGESKEGTEEAAEGSEEKPEASVEEMQADEAPGESAEASEGAQDDTEEKEGTSVEATEETEEKESGERAAEGDSGEPEAGADDSGDREDDGTKEEKSEETDEKKSAEEEVADDGKSDEQKDETEEVDKEADEASESKADEDQVSTEEPEASEAASKEEVEDAEGASKEAEASIEDSGKEEEDTDKTEEEKSAEDAKVSEEEQESAEKIAQEESKEESKEGEEAASEADVGGESAEAEGKGESKEEGEAAETASVESTESQAESVEKEGESVEEKAEENEEAEEKDEAKSRGRREAGEAQDETGQSEEKEGEGTEEEKSGEAEGSKEREPTPEEDLIQEIEIPENLRPREHINQLLKLDEENEEREKAIQRVADIILRDLKRLYENAIKPLETLYKYRDLSNRHFGDPEIFSKPLVLFMGPWSGGKSSIINYLLDIEYKQTSLRTGAEPSPAYFNILMYGEEEEVLDGTQLAADWTFSGLQKFGQGLLDRLRGRRLNHKLLEKVNIVEIPGILEIRKQVQRLFPFNDACQWFIDRADIIFLVYDPSKLDVGPETEAILDQLKGREYQTRIILNKADQVKPEELMRVQGALIWNISPLMSSAEPPIMYSTSLWSLPYEAGAPTRLLYAQERAFLRDLRTAIDKRVEHKIASARRFAVRVRNHAKMVDCYLTTYYNHKSIFGNKKEISDKIVENPQDYHIYEGLSTLTNISRYDLPDPDVYRDFFRLNPLYDFPLLSSTCTYFRGCPINRLDVAIAYDLPELVGKYRKSVEALMHESDAKNPVS